MSDEYTDDTERIEKSAVGPADALQLSELVHKIELIAVDSLPKLDRSTVRIETVEKIGNGMHEITISGEKSEFCPTTGETNHPIKPDPDRNGGDTDE